MNADHPERGVDNGLEPTVGEQLRLGELLQALDRASEAEVREIAKKMAQQVMVTYPSALRYLAREAARNLSGEPWRPEASEKLLAALSAPHEDGKP